jgi:multimeric flavodoxin WrbA
MKKTAILFSSSRQEGNTSALVNSINQKSNADVYNLKDYQISPFDYEHKNIDDDFVPLIKQLLNYQHMVFASPVYWYSMTAQMKVFFDRVSDLLHVKKELGRQLRMKECSIVTTGASTTPERSFEETFINSFDYLGMHYKGMLYCFCEKDFIKKQHESDITNFIQNNLL